MEISAATATTGSSKPLLLRPLALSTPTTSSTTTTIHRRPSPSASATVRRRVRTRPRTRRSKPTFDAGDSFSGDDGDGPDHGGTGGGRGWNHGFGSGSGPDWGSSELAVPEPRRSAAEVALGVVYELMCLIALANCTQFAVRRLAGLLAVRVVALRFASSPPSAEMGVGGSDRTVRSPTAPVS